MRIAQISDLHFTRTSWNPLRLFSKRMLGNLNWLFFRRDRFLGKPLALLPALFQELKVDLILVGGDMTTTALESEFEAAQEFIKEFHCPCFSIPGNHDLYTKRSEKQRRFYRYFPQEHLQAKRLSTHLLDNGWHLICLDTALATPLYSSQGLFTQELEALLEAELQKIQGPALILNHYPFFPSGSTRHGLIRAEKLKALLEKYPKARLYLHGHTHRQIMADLRPSHLPVVLDAGSAAQGSWHLLELKNDRCHATAYRWGKTWEPVRSEEFIWKR